MDIVKLENLYVNYGEKEVLRDINLSFKKNSITSIIGPSGCGKSTLLTSLNMLLEEYGGRHRGKILFKDKDIKDYKQNQLRKMLGMVFQQPTPFPLSIEKNLVYGPIYYGIKDKKVLEGLVEFNLKRVGLLDEINNEWNKSALKLSGGQQQRLSIARALTVEPEILLLDEPCSALDVKNTALIEELLLKLSKDYTIIIVTHNLSQAKRISDYTAFLLDGELIEYRKTEDIFANPEDIRTRDYLQGVYG